MTALVTEVDIPDSDCIDPADYPDTTAYLNAIPGMAESLIELMKTPLNEYEDWDDFGDTTTKNPI